MYRQINIQQFYVLPTQCMYGFCVDLRINSDYFHVQHQLTGVYSRNGKCLLRGTTEYLYIIRVNPRPLPLPEGQTGTAWEISQQYTFCFPIILIIIIISYYCCCASNSTPWFFSLSLRL